MTLEQLEIFFQIAGGKTYLAVADERNMSQSSVSRMMRAMEDEMEVSLLRRDGRSIALTQAGQALHHDLQDLMPEIHRMLMHVRSYTQQQKSISYAIVPKTPFLRMNRVIEAFGQMMPDCRVQEIDVPRIQDAWDKLRKYQLDFLIMHRPNYLDTGIYQSFAFLEDRLMAALPVGHPLAEHTSIQPEELQDERMLLNSNSFYDMMQVSERCGIQFRADYQPLTRIDLLMQVIELKRAGIVWQSETKLFQFSSLRFVPLAIEPVPFVLITHSQELMPHQKLFLRTFRENASKLNNF